MVIHWRHGFSIAVGILLVLEAGCLTLDTKLKEAPTGIPVEAAVTWQPYVLFAADPAREGASSPGLAGRLYLFGPQLNFPIAASGKVEVRLYADPADPENPSAPLEIWKIDSETLKSRLQHDVIGWGYSLLLPWGTYRPDLTHIRLTVRFDSEKGGMPLYGQETHLTLHGQGPPEVVITTKMPEKPKEGP